MAVYVDNMYLTSMGEYRGMKMSHMVADTEKELLAMAFKIGLQLKWYQKPPKVKYPHFDISITMRRKAISFGALEITMKEAVLISKRNLENGKYKE